MASIRQTATAVINPGPAITVAMAPREVGNLLIVFGVVADAGATLTCSDTGGHTWTTMTGPLVDAGVAVTQSWWTYATSTSSSTFQVAKTGADEFLSIIVHEIIGIVSIGGTPVSDADTATGTGTPTAPTITPTRDHTFLWAGVADSATAATAPWTVWGNDTQQDLTAWRQLNGGNGVGQSMTFTGSGDYSIHIAALFTAAVTGSRVDDRFRFRESVLWSGTSTRGTKRSAWPDDARDFGRRDSVADQQSRIV